MVEFGVEKRNWGDNGEGKTSSARGERVGIGFPCNIEIGAEVREGKVPLALPGVRWYIPSLWVGSQPSADRWRLATNSLGVPLFTLIDVD